MQDIKDISITIDDNTDTYVYPGIVKENVFKVTREGIGLRIVDTQTFTYTGQDIGTVQFRAYNPTAAVPSGAGITLGAAGGGPVIYTRVVIIAEPVGAGSIYSLTVDGTTVSYTAITGDTNQEVATALNDAINALSLGYPIGSVIGSFLGEYYLTISTGGIRTYSVNLEPADYWISKSALVWYYLGEYYIFNLATGKETIPMLPTIIGPYNYTDMVKAASGLLAYFSDVNYPIVDTYTYSAAVGVASIDNVPDGSSTSLLGHDVLIDNTLELLKFGQAFISGSPETITIIYK